MQKNISLKSLIYKSYLSSALVPVFAIELVLLLLYFGVTFFISQKSQDILLDEAKLALNEIASREAGHIDMLFSEVKRDMAILKRDHERFFTLNECSSQKVKAEFGRHKNGALYKLVDNGGSSIYAPKDFDATPKNLKKIECSEFIDPLMKSIVDTNPIITQAYINTYDKINRLYPFMSDAATQYGAELDATSYNFYYLADANYNPKRKDVWTSAYLDPAGQGWMISIIAPIYNGNFLEGVSGLDVTIDSLIKNVLSLDIPWSGSAFLIDKDGTIIAMPKRIEELFSIKELKGHTYTSTISTTIEKPKEFNLLKNSKEMESFFKKATPIDKFTIKGANYIISQKIIPQTNWRLMVVVDEFIIYRPIMEFKSQAQIIGYVVIALMIFFYLIFFIYLMRKSNAISEYIAKPINELSTLTSNLGTKPNTQLRETGNIEEIYKLVQNFNTLSNELDDRTNAYIESQMREKMKEKEALSAYREGLLESAGGYLHNVGNSLAILDSKLFVLKSSASSLQKSELGFNKVIEMVQNSHAKGEEKVSMEVFLEAFKEALSDDITSEILDVVDGIERVKNHASEMIKDQQDRLANRDGSENYVYSFSLNKMLSELIEDYSLEFFRFNISIKVHENDEVVVQIMKYRLQSGVANVIKNAIESISLSKNSGNGIIDITIKREKNMVLLIVQDNGCGVARDDIDKIFGFGYTTKKGGSGFGLHTLNNFLNSIGGTINITNNESENGATLMMEIPINE
ncbi:Cache sensor signal transduction histidine kinase [Sulfurimonas denitrificans DSM 1251]|uniref:histidine kinase n=1 Tax=Sulfurimonas denitrificans (strain ATCC 33889 / DSM 1251) TaxID=326298 RepID=Q30RY8_SULDN|nr:ATP-binding protein [Sulfurimonas denitrificans]ABB44243.1 Cache sensor signal transduction histidine kinase [Sulfurimonas denitrificans DSM 1251]MDD3443497.1 ATP-binding protein [Sulfurimonas denitrificans]